VINALSPCREKEKKTGRSVIARPEEKKKEGTQRSHLPPRKKTKGVSFNGELPTKKDLHALPTKGPVAEVRL